MAKPEKIYVVDTCSFTTMHKTYPRDVFPGVWDKVIELIEAERLISVDEVLHEITRQDDQLAKWAKTKKGIFVPLTNDVQDAAKEVVNRFVKILDFKKNKSGADPFVIGLAMIRQGAVVVTEEKYSGGPDKHKIPDICDALNIPYANFLSMIKAEGLKL
jgi:hypothetical protein